MPKAIYMLLKLTEKEKKYLVQLLRRQLTMSDYYDFTGSGLLEKIESDGKNSK